ncbi:MAG: C25 family cysteine peptidase [Bacteroidales bacterium]|jgi:hypothetical protein|nr:C25 family cysteine peptidase [Bacteroidales bacterium]
MNLINIKRFIFTVTTCVYGCFSILLSAQSASESKYKTEFVYSNSAANKQLIQIPDIKDIADINSGRRPSRTTMRNSEYIIQTKPHKAYGDKYIILTDHTDKGYLKSLKKLEQYRNGKIIKVPDLATLYKNTSESEELREKLISHNVEYIAIAPKPESYRENMILGVYELLCNLDDDPELDAYPGILLASDAEKFEALINRTINYTPKSVKELKPMASCMVHGLKELRSLQKNGIIHNYFAGYGLNIPMLNLFKSDMNKIPKLSGSSSINVDISGKKSIKTLPKQIVKPFNESTLLVLHGHGIPGSSCGIDIDALPQPYNTDIILCGSCFSASPKRSDLPSMRKSPDGHNMENRQSFALKAIDNGATVVYGHMRLNAGFPKLFPVLKSLTEGASVGQAYQETINVGIIGNKFDTKKLAVRETPQNPRRIKQNNILYVIFGDPALKPIKASTEI